MLALSVYRKGDLDLRIQIIFVTALETRRTQFGHIHIHMTGPSSLGVPGVPRHTQILEDQLTLFQPGGQIMPIHLLLAHPDFQTFRRP